MKEVIKEKDLRKANNLEKANMLKKIAQGQAVYEKTKEECRTSASVYSKI